MLTEDQLQRIVPKMKSEKVGAYLPHLNAAMETFEIDTPLRTAAFIAQLAHESGSFVWMKEIWGPTAQQQRYEPPDPLAARLGNTQPGDGRRYMGRGPIQLTGRSNYERFGRLLGLDLVGNPDQVATPDVGFQVAGLYWKSRDINAPADADDIVEVTRRVNGGRIGLAERTEFYERAKQVLAEGFVAAPATRGARPASPMPDAPLERGRPADAPPVWAEERAPAPTAPAAAPQTAPVHAPPAASAVAPAAVPAAKKPQAKKAGARKTPANQGAPATPAGAPNAPAAGKATAKKAISKKATAKKAPAKKAPAKKALAKKASARRAPAKKALAKKASASRAPAKKAPAKKASTRPAAAKTKPAKKAPARRASAGKVPAKKAPARKSPAKKPAARKAPARKAVSR